MLEDFCYEQTLNLRMFKSQPDNKIQYRDFDGGVVVSRACDGWWVLNHVTNKTGRRDLAWLWNAQTDEILRVPSELFPRRAPVIHYVPALRRFLATESCRVDLLLPAHQLIDALRAYATAGEISVAT